MSTELRLITDRRVYRTRGHSTVRWTTPDRALKQIKRGRRVVRARDFNTATRDSYGPWDGWAGHIGLIGKVSASCGCQRCTRARFNMKVV